MAMGVSEIVQKYKHFIGRYSSQVDTLESAEQIICNFRSALAEKDIILYGAGCVGRDLAVLLMEMGIKISKIVDKNWTDIGVCGGISVESPESLKSAEAMENSIAIAACDRRQMSEILRDIEELHAGIKNIECGHDIHMLLQSAWCMTKAVNDRGITLKNCYECTCLDSTCISLRTYLKKMNQYEEHQECGTDKVQMIGYLLSNICTLNCKNCCEAVPYMPKKMKRFIPAERVINDINKMSSACSFLTLVEFIGGEPFLHPQLPQVIKEVLKIPNVGMVHIFTNGTVIPSDELCSVLGNSRITVYISNYQVSYPDKFKGEASQTANKLEQYEVPFFFGKKQNWMDFTTFELKEENEEKLSSKFNDCFLHNCNRLMDGKLYVCPHQYAGIQLGYLEEANIIDIYAYTDQQLAEELDKFKGWTYLQACRQCPMPDAPIVLSGEQI